MVGVNYVTHRPEKNRKKREKEQRRNTIINAAENIFFAKDYDNVSMDDIAKDAELSKALLYYYFRDKEALFYAVARRSMDILGMLVRKRFSSDNSGARNLNALGRAYAEFATEHPGHFRAYGYLLSGRFDLRNPTNNEDLKEFLDRRHTSVDLTCRMIETGIRDGSIRPSVSPVEVATLLELICDSFPRLTPQQIERLEAGEINKEQFIQDTVGLIGRMFVNEHCK
ncbi:MAG TPA: TetR/AcrR family transcriptional regulator [Methanocella sp.]|nr:TetR/AcrR family transcriptional regulator [Methanocella sp.]